MGLTPKPALQLGSLSKIVSPVNTTTAPMTTRFGRNHTATARARAATAPSATIRGDSNSAQYKISSAPDRDDWDRWNSDRDHMIRDASSWHHTNRYYTGSQDLDAYGQWKHVDDYGDVWYPNETSDWVPYRNGNWVYEPYYGWTWVGYEPWGWAPYHYGAWYRSPVYGWCWYPPRPATIVPVWRPALVAFLDRRFQPHLDEMQHVSIADSPSHRLHQIGVGNAVEVAAQVGVDHLRVPSIQ